MPQTADQFVAKWSKAELSERAASQEHFLDLCRLLGQPTPAEADPAGDHYTFEKAVKVVAAASKGAKGEGGFVDVWKRGCFGWEYKRKDKYKSLDEAYRQLYQYRDALDNPPLSIVCDIRTTEIRTHFTGYPPTKTVIKLEELPGKLEILKRAFTNPNSFRETLKPSVQVTADLAREFGELADKLILRYPPSDLTLFQRAGDKVAHFLMKVMFCLFAEDINLLPDRLFTRLVNRCLFEPDAFAPNCGELFDKMKKGGWYGNDRVDHFNGGLFDDAPPLALNSAELNDLVRATGRDWSAVEPSIFGTLFERILDPRKRAQIGAHYTAKDDILLVVDPVVMTPLRRRWQAVRDDIAPALATHDAEPSPKKRDTLAAPIRTALEDYRQHLHAQRVLDPACGSGNFLYVALQRLLDLEDEVVRFAAKHDIAMSSVPRVRPTQMHGIEINPYAAELAQIVVWIGYLQWTHDHLISDERRPILDKLEMIENRDAILDQTDKAHPKRAGWPAADFVVGNPPFLGSTDFEASGIEPGYKDAIEQLYNLKGKSDLCCYWFAHAADDMQQGEKTRYGLLGNTTIRFGVARAPLDRIASQATIFAAWSNRKWFSDGAAVRICIACFSSTEAALPVLDGLPVPRINADLTGTIDLTKARKLPENANLSFEGDQKGGPFDISWQTARDLMAVPSLGLYPTYKVLRRRMNGNDLSRVRWKSGWVIDFGPHRSLDEAANSEAVLAYLEDAYRAAEKKAQAKGLKVTKRAKWWIHKCPRPRMLAALAGTSRQLVTSRVATHRIFAWLDSDILPDSRLLVFARSDDYFFGVLQSTVHAMWALSNAPPHGVGNDPTYAAATCFDPFPFPWKPGMEDASHPAYQRITVIAKALSERRERWLNPPEWIDPIAAKVDATDDFTDVPAEVRQLVRQSAIMAAAAKDTQLKGRTLTKLYNKRETWLRLAHDQLDRAVLAAYAATDPAGGWSEDWAAVWTDAGAGQPLPADHPLAEQRKQTDAAVLAALLRLNGERGNG